MNVHKARASIQGWTAKLMNSIRYSIYEVILQVCQELENGEQLPSGTIPSLEKLIELARANSLQSMYTHNRRQNP